MSVLQGFNALKGQNDEICLSLVFIWIYFYDIFKCVTYFS
jgi:hypothetical protein